MRRAIHQDIVDQALARDTKALADAVARDVGQCLRAQLVAIIAGGGEAASHPGIAQGSPPTGDPIGVLAHVLEHAERQAGILAAQVDAARSAGLARERACYTLTH